MREAAQRKEADRRAAQAKNSWSGWLRSYWTNMEYNHASTPALDDSTNTGSAFDDFINSKSPFDEFIKSTPPVPTPSAGALVPDPSSGPPTGRSTKGRTSTRTSTAEGSEFKKSRVSKRERMSTNYIW